MQNHTTRLSPEEIPYGYCHCGCGQLAPIAKFNDLRFGHTKGQPKRFVRSHHLAPPRTLAEALWQYVTPGEKDECWLWQGKSQVNGYGIISHGYKKLKAHRVSYELHIGKIPGKLCVLHHCDNPQCVNPNHLFLGTISDNNKDKLNKERQPRGETHGSHKLTEMDVAEIRRLFLANVTMYRLSKLFGVTSASIRNIIRRKTWVHVL